jgi:tetrahydromethanopterin S-methyltransferase subunit B
MKEMPNDSSMLGSEAWMARLDEKITQLEIKVDHINEKLDGRYVTVDRFKPVEKLAYGAAAVILLGFLGAIIALVVKI